MNPVESIIDTSRPNAGRIYDYFLGGHHNFEVDRQAADQLIGLLPFLPRFARLQRWCLQDLALELAERRGYDVIIDFASGLPTNDHIHHVVPMGTHVIYSDYDPLVVEYAREILEGTPNVHFFQADARRPNELLSRPAVQEILGERRDVAIVYWGVSALIGDDDLAHAARALAEWAGPASCWAFQAQGVDLNADVPNIRRAREIYRQMGSPTYPRSLDQIAELLRPWRVGGAGFVSLLDWHSLSPELLTGDDLDAWGQAGGGYGGYLAK